MGPMIQTLIVDDEKPARDELAYLLKAFPEINLVGQGRNGVEAIALIKEYTPDLVFLDVQMPGLNGLGVIKKLVDRKLKVPHIIFATAYDNYAVNAFEVNAVDYVLKPFDKGRISKAIQRAKMAREAEGSSNYRTLEELQAALDSDVFWRPHRSFLVNINHIKEVVPWFKSSYVLKMNDKKATEIPVSRAQTKRLRELFKL